MLKNVNGNVRGFQMRLEDHRAPTAQAPIGLTSRHLCALFVLHSKNILLVRHEDCSIHRVIFCVVLLESSAIDMKYHTHVKIQIYRLARPHWPHDSLLFVTLALIAPEAVLAQTQPTNDHLTLGEVTRFLASDA